MTKRTNSLIRVPRVHAFFILPATLVVNLLPAMAGQMGQMAERDTIPRTNLKVIEFSESVENTFEKDGNESESATAPTAREFPDFGSVTSPRRKIRKQIRRPATPNAAKSLIQQSLESKGLLADLPPPDAQPQLSGRGSVAGHPDFDHLDYAYNHLFQNVNVEDRGSKHPDDYLKANGKGGQLGEVYGEVLPQAVLQMFHEAGAAPGMRFYDLGSGSGKLPMIGWLLGMKATGIELSPIRHNHACQALARLKAIDHRPPSSSDQLEYHHGSFLETEFRDADIIFTDSVMWTEDMMEKLAQSAQGMKPGAKIFSMKPFPNPEPPQAPWFKTLKTLQLQASWEMTSVIMQERLPSTVGDASSAAVIQTSPEMPATRLASVDKATTEPATEEHCIL